MDSNTERMELGLSSAEASALRRAAAREGVAPETLLRRSLRALLHASDRLAGAGAAPDEMVARRFE